MIRGYGIKVAVHSGMTRPSLLVLLLALTAGPVAAGPSRVLPLTAGQPILEADAVLLSSGWRPHPQNAPQKIDQQRAGVPLSSLSACSGTGIGFCRFDYRRNGRQLSVVTVPVPGAASRERAIGGIVDRWWVETVAVSRP